MFWVGCTLEHYANGDRFIKGDIVRKLKENSISSAKQNILSIIFIEKKVLLKKKWNSHENLIKNGKACA